MIKKERLQELIKNRATIYYLSIFDTNDKEVIEHKPSKSRVYKNLDDGSITIDDIYDEYWFESREDAEFANEFKRVARIDYLDLPTWEEFIEMSSFIFENKDRINLEMAIWCCDTEDLQIKTIKITNLNNWNIRLFEQPLTKENYTLACRKAKELFLGSDVEI